MEMGHIKGRNSKRKERRKFHRIQDNIFIFCRPEPYHRIIEWIAKDISEMGLGFESDEFVAPSTSMEIEIYQPLDYRKSRIVSIHVLAKVVWIKKIKRRNRYPASNRYVGGVKFTKISKRDRSIIANYVNERYKKRGYSP